MQSPLSTSFALCATLNYPDPDPDRLLDTYFSYLVFRNAILSLSPAFVFEPGFVVANAILHNPQDLRAFLTPSRHHTNLI